MPEGHTVHRLARELGELVGRTVAASSPQGRFAAGAAAVDGAVLDRTDAYGKHLLLGFGGPTVQVHLGMQGKWFRYPDPTAPPLRQVRLRLASDDVAWDLIAPSVCELLDADAVQRLVAGLGPDPLRADAAESSAVDAFAADPRPIGTVLLDQAVVAGVGNVFRNEALHAIGVHPTRPSRSLSTEQLTELWRVLQRMMRQAVDDGRIVTVDADPAVRATLPEAQARRVYKQERCRDCGASVAVVQIGGRTAYLCPEEQPG
jgi:endonuclease-8